MANSNRTDGLLGLCRGTPLLGTPLLPFKTWPSHEPIALQLERETRLRCGFGVGLFRVSRGSFGDLGSGHERCFVWLDFDELA
jgi:hypothetical protein